MPMARYAVVAVSLPQQPWQHPVFGSVDNVLTQTTQWGEVSGGIEFDWDAENTRHLKRHRVTPNEFEELMTGDLVYLEYQARNDEERYKVLGCDRGRPRPHWNLDAAQG